MAPSLLTKTRLKDPTLDEADFCGDGGGKDMGVEPKIGVKPPKSSNFNKVFPYFHHPFSGPTPIFGNTHMIVLYALSWQTTGWDPPKPQRLPGLDDDVPFVMGMFCYYRNPPKLVFNFKHIFFGNV